MNYLQCLSKLEVKGWILLFACGRRDSPYCSCPHSRMSSRLCRHTSGIPSCKFWFQVRNHGPKIETDSWNIQLWIGEEKMLLKATKQSLKSSLQKWQITDFWKSSLFDPTSQSCSSPLFGVFTVAAKSIWFWAENPEIWQKGKDAKHVRIFYA